MDISDDTRDRLHCESVIIEQAQAGCADTHQQLTEAIAELRTLIEKLTPAPAEPEIDLTKMIRDICAPGLESLDTRADDPMSDEGPAIMATLERLTAEVKTARQERARLVRGIFDVIDQLNHGTTDFNATRFLEDLITGEAP